MELNNSLGLYEISMGMSGYYMEAIKYKSTFVRIGSAIFGDRIQYISNFVFLSIRSINNLISYLFIATHPFVPWYLLFAK